MVTSIKRIVVRAAESPLKAVAVYLTQAELKRHVSVNVPEAGEYNLEFQLLQDTIQLDSARVELHGKGVTLVEVQTGYSPTTKQAVIYQNLQVQTWFEEFKQLAGQKVEVEERRKVIQQRQGTLERLLASVTHEKSGIIANLTELNSEKSGAILRGVVDLSASIEEKTIQSVKELLKLNDEIGEMTETMEGLVEKIRKHSGVDIPFSRDQRAGEQLANLRRPLYVANHVRSKPYIRVHVRTEGSVEVTGSLSYITSGCNWRPRYDLKMRSDDFSKVELTYLGQVTQNSQEDWNDVRVALHTGEPSSSGEPPILQPLTAEFERPIIPFKAGVSYVVQSDFSPMMRGVGAMPARKLAAVPRQNENQNQGEAVFELPGQLTIPSDNECHRFQITEQIFGTSMIFYCAPEASGDVFRAGSCRNTSDFLLLGGPVSVYWDGAMVASTNLGTINPGEIFHTFFGKEQLIKMDVRPEKKFRKTTGWKIGGTSDRQTFERTVTVVNHRKQPVIVMSIFRLPMSTDADIKIAIDSTISAEVVELDDDMEAVAQPVYERMTNAANETLVWVENKRTHHVVGFLKLTEGSKKNVIFSYSTESPQDKELIIQ